MPVTLYIIFFFRPDLKMLSNRENLPEVLNLKNGLILTFLSVYIFYSLFLLNDSIKRNESPKPLIIKEIMPFKERTMQTQMSNQSDPR